MDKRKEMFLSRNPFLKRFTKNSVIKHFGLTSDEFDELLKNDFIVEDTNDICINCLRIWNHDYDECFYCGEEGYVKEKGFYRYK